MASGEMSEEEFRSFLATPLAPPRAYRVMEPSTLSAWIGDTWTSVSVCRSPTVYGGSF